MEQIWDEKQRTKKRQKTEYELRVQKVREDKEITGYQASETERQTKETPKEKVLVETQEGFLSAGYQSDGKILVAISKDKGDYEWEDESRLKKEGARRVRLSGRQTYTNSSDPKKSAVAFEANPRSNKKKLLETAKRLAEKEKNDTVSSLLPYLREKEDKEQITELEDEARQKSQMRDLVFENRRQAAILRERLSAKEREKRRLLAGLENGFAEKQGEKKEKESPRRWMSLTGILPLDEEQEEEDGSGQEGNKADQKKM